MMRLLHKITAFALSSIYIFVPVVLAFGLSFGAYLTHTYKCLVAKSVNHPFPRS